MRKLFRKQYRNRGYPDSGIHQENDSSSSSTGCLSSSNPILAAPRPAGYPGGNNYAASNNHGLHPPLSSITQPPTAYPYPIDQVMMIQPYIVPHPVGDHDDGTTMFGTQPAQAHHGYLGQRNVSEPVAPESYNQPVGQPSSCPHSARDDCGGFSVKPFDNLPLAHRRRSHPYYDEPRSIPTDSLLNPPTLFQVDHDRSLELSHPIVQAANSSHINAPGQALQPRWKIGNCNNNNKCGNQSIEKVSYCGSLPLSADVEIGSGNNTNEGGHQTIGTIEVCRQ